MRFNYPPEHLSSVSVQIQHDITIPDRHAIGAEKIEEIDSTASMPGTLNSEGTGRIYFFPSYGETLLLILREEEKWRVVFW